jgi:probable phosphoglycerate mutase
MNAENGMTITNLVLIRHALNDWVGNRLAGWTPDVHLNDEGRAQVADLVGRLSETRLSAIYTSPLERALETAHPLAQAQGQHPVIRDALAEVRYGTWTGRELKALQEEKLWPIVQTYPSGARFPGGESLREVQTRMVAELDAIVDAHRGETVAAVSHSDPIKLAVAFYAGLSLDLFQRLTVSPASVTILSFSPFGPRLAVLNHTSALPSLGPPEQEEEH